MAVDKAQIMTGDSEEDIHLLLPQSHSTQMQIFFHTCLKKYTHNIHEMLKKSYTHKV